MDVDVDGETEKHKVLVRYIFVKNHSGQALKKYGGRKIKGFSRKETLEIIKEAMHVKLTATIYSGGKPIKRSPPNIVFAKYTLDWAKGE